MADSANQFGLIQINFTYDAKYNTTLLSSLTDPTLYVVVPAPSICAAFDPESLTELTNIETVELLLLLLRLDLYTSNESKFCITLSGGNLRVTDTIMVILRIRPVNRLVVVVKNVSQSDADEIVIILGLRSNSPVEKLYITG